MRVSQGIPSIERAANGRLWAAWYGGETTGSRYNYVMLVTSDDDGRSWSSLKLVIDPDGRGPVRACDPCLWHDPLGRLWLLWAQMYDTHERGNDDRCCQWAVRTSESDNENPTWTAPERVCAGTMLNKPTVLSSGEWLLPVAFWREQYSAKIFCSTEDGATFHLLGEATIPEEQERNCDEHMIVERNDGSLWLLARTRHGLGESVSLDRGRTWCEVRRSTIQHTTSRFFIRRLTSGELLLVKHGALDERTIERSRLTAFLSCDDGAAWSGGLVLDERDNVSYPDGVQAEDGAIYIIYDFQRHAAKEILMAVFTEQDVARGECVSARSRLRVRINKATGVRESQA